MVETTTRLFTEGNHSSGDDGDDEAHGYNNIQTM